ncbi:hypothetical protein PMAYCL1PPCAC_18211, partial [Pristionchus mayeri]
IQMTSQEGHTWRLIVDYVDEMRSKINAGCLHLESWQVASYTLSLIFLVLYILDLAASEKGVVERIRARMFYILRSLPWVHRRLNEDLARAKKELEEEVHSNDVTRDFYKFIPERGLGRDEIRAEAELYRAMGRNRKEIVSERKTDAVVHEISALFGGTNPRDSHSFSGCRKMESEIVRMSLSLFHGGSTSIGVVVPSSAESLLVALSSARSLSARQSIIHPTVLASAAAAPALFHSAKLLGLRVKVVPSKRDGTLEAATLKRFITSETALIFVSAPNHSTGTCDPIDSIAKVALRYHIPLHVDCSLGGLILPFIELCDYGFDYGHDFRLPGVTSISIDLSRFSACPSSCALTLFRDEQMMKAAVFPLAEWPGGMYSSPSLSDCLDGSAVAAVWTTLLSTGKSGFMEITQKVVESTKKLATLLAEIDGITVLGSADTVMVAFETEKPYDIYHIIEAMRSKGWPLHPLVSPPAARFNMSISLARDDVVDAFLDDLDTTLVHLRNNPHLGESSASRAFHQLIATAADRWLVRELATERALAHYSVPLPPDNRKSLRFSVEGRKLSMVSDLMERRKEMTKE